MWRTRRNVFPRVVVVISEAVVVIENFQSSPAEARRIAGVGYEILRVHVFRWVESGKISLDLLEVHQVFAHFHDHLDEFPVDLVIRIVWTGLGCKQL
jgi:hypothetical protein